METNASKRSVSRSTKVGSVSRSTKVGSAAAFLLFLGVALWMVAVFVEVNSVDALKFYGTAAQLWPSLIGAAAFGWIIQSALPDE